MPGTAFMLFVIAAVMFLTAVTSVWRSHRVISRGLATYGTVAEAPDRTGIEDGDHRVIEYNVLSGEKVRITDSRGVRSGRFKVGERVPLVFVPDCEGHHRVLDFRDLWAVPIAVGGFAAVLAVLGLIALP